MVLMGIAVYGRQDGESNFIEGELGGDVQVLDHVFELFEADAPVEVQVCLDDGAVHQLLQLHVRQVVPHHHLQHVEELAVRDEAVLVDVVDLKGEDKLLLLVVAVQGGQACVSELRTGQELAEADLPVLVYVENRNHPLHQRILRQLRHVKDLLRVQVAASV